MNFTESEFSKFLTAVKFSAEKHRDQRRKGVDGSPYINHPISVAELLWEAGKVRDMNVLVAAILHDTIEDTETSPDEIKTLFGDDVLSLVRECTDDKSLPKDERKRLQILNAPHKSSRAKQIKLADKINNVEDITHHPPSHWDDRRRVEYLDWAEQVVSGLRDANNDLANHFDTVVRTAREKLGAV